MNIEKSKIARPKKTFIERNDCLDKNMNDKSPLVPEVPHKKVILNEYEKQNHREKIVRNPKTFIPQEDNAFNFQPLGKGRDQKRKAENPVPSNYYKKSENAKMSYNHYLSERPPKSYNEKGRKDNIEELFGKKKTEGGNSYMDRPHKKVNYKYTGVQQIFDSGKYNIPVGYKEPTVNPGKVDFDLMSDSAKNNIENIKKNGRKPLQRDF
jgi:hypothetical protein